MRIAFLVLLLLPPAAGITLLLRAGEQLRNFVRLTPALESQTDLEKFKSIARRQMSVALAQSVILIFPVLAYAAGIFFHVLLPADFVWILIPAVLVILAAIRIKEDEKKVWSTPARGPEFLKARDRIVHTWRFKAFPDW